jgi:hypothetical protein
MITACKAQARSSIFEISKNPLWYASCGFTIELYASIDAEAGDAPFQKCGFIMNRLTTPIA